MKFVCEKTCQIDVGDEGSPVVTLIGRGEVVELPKKRGSNHPCFRPLVGDSTDVDFVNASEQELRETDFDVEDANAAMKEAFGKGLDKGKDPVDSIIDIRHRNNERTEQEKLIEEGKKARIDKKAKNKGKGKK